MAKQPHSTGRRSFFKKVAVCAGALFLAQGAGRAAAEPGPDKERARQTDTRYRHTEHIRKYYETAMR
ncbi:MAG: hypothetical protein K9K39_10255 [Desulfohalobiaceae bacterium]|nr:hypothetical protein [Desulfohalobiaceae bacterium]